MNTIHREQLLRQLQWRYATKQFDPNSKVSPEDWAALEQALVLTPSSFGLQPWHFLVVTNPATKEQLVAASWGQRQVADCSHLVVFAAKNDFSLREVDAYVQRLAQVRNVPIGSLAGFRDMVISSLFNGMDHAERRAWATRQVYIALGSFLTSAALLGIDACPMEGIEASKYDEILGLQKKGLHTVVVCAAGYRAATDKYAALKKVRFPKEAVIAEV